MKYDENNITFNEGIAAKNGDVIKVIIDLMENIFKIKTSFYTYQCPMNQEHLGDL